MKDEILTFLKQEDNYCSGEEISQKLGVTRAAVWKSIKKLQEEGYVITSSTKKGYKLIEIPNIITPGEIKENLQTNILGQYIEYKSEIDSTNNWAKDLARMGASEGTLVVADKQTKGKGRLGRYWESPAGTGIWMSLILRPNILPQFASQLTLIAGLNVCEAIEEVTGLEAKIKWPNDVVINNKKVCGILTEMSAEMELINYVIVGIGINANMKEFPEELPHATSIALETKKECIRKDIIQSFLEKFEKDYETYKNEKSLFFVKDRYERNCITLHKTVKLINEGHESIAEAIGITNTGELMVRHEDGREEEVMSGEVSVRGLYGYI